LRPWPWILVALASTVIYPQLSDIARAYPYVDPNLIGPDMAYSAMYRFLPAPFLGFMIAGMLASYRSTIETHLNWGTSYLVHDLYRRFLNKGASEKHYVLVGRLTTALLMIVAALATYALSTSKQAFDLILSVGAGTGLIYLLRWFWWRVNAWCEVAAMVSSFLVALGFAIAARAGHAVPGHISLILTVASTTVVWVAVAYLTPPTDRTTLLSFYKLVRPAGPGWESIRQEAGLPPSPDNLPNSLLGWVCGCAFIYSALFGTGSALYGRTPQAILWAAVFLVSGFGLLRLVPRMWGKQETDRP